jgi:hypothetical protein
MIFVQEQPEPADFGIKVRSPGQAFLVTVPSPSNKQFKAERHWRHCLQDLYAAYDGVCAYSAHWIPPKGTVDHYLPKSSVPRQAYEWSNFRLCLDKINNYKDDKSDVMDPFRIQNGWFVIDFATLFIRAEDTLADYLKIAVDATIARLKLNDDNDLVQERFNWVERYSNDEFPFEHLLRRYPFIALELERQNLKERIKARFKRP